MMAPLETTAALSVFIVAPKFEAARRGIEAEWEKKRIWGCAACLEAPVHGVQQHEEAGNVGGDDG